jgi:hypothetical protein
LANQKEGNSSQIIFITLLLRQVLGFAGACIPSSANRTEELRQNHSAEPKKTGMSFFKLFFIQF